MFKKYIILSTALFAVFTLQSQNDLDAIIESEMKAAMRSFHTPNQNKTNELTQVYDLKYHRFEWNINPSSNYISGAVTSYFVAAEEDMNEINFQLSVGFTIDSAIFHGTSVTANWANQHVKVSFPETVMMGELDSVTVYYKGVPGSGGFGAFETSYHNGTPIMWTLSEPYGAMDWWPCKQDLDDKIDSVDIYVNTPSQYRAASNGLLVEEIANGDHTIYHWKHRYPIPAYLVAIAVTNYAYYSDWVPLEGYPDLEVLNYVYPEDLAYAQSNTPGIIEILQFYHETFKAYPYMNEKYGHAQFGWGGGMEHTTMSFMGSFNYDLMAHELAHMWFGDDITCGSWVDIWLNEGFATYLTAINHEYQGHTSEWNNWKSGAISYITSSSGGSVMVDDTTSVGRIFDGRLSYRKGAMLLHMLRWEMGDEDFFQAIQNYINDENLSYSYAKTAQLQAHLEDQSGLDLDEFFSDWYEGQGYPSHQIEYSQVGNSVLVFVHQNQSHSSVDFFELTLPLRFSGQGQDTIVSLKYIENDQYFNLDLDFEVSSVNYDPDKWLISKNNTVTLSVDELTKRLGLKLYPNPAVTELNLLFARLPTESLTYKIVDVSGSVLQAGELQIVEQMQTLDIRDLAKGSYFLVLNTPDQQAVIRFVKSGQ